MDRKEENMKALLREQIWKTGPIEISIDSEANLSVVNVT
jgi:hypothetical protein